MKVKLSSRLLYFASLQNFNKFGNSLVLWSVLVVPTADEGPVPVGGAGGSTKVVVKGNVVEASTEAGVGDAEAVLTGALPSGLGDADDDANGADMKGVVEGKIVEALNGAGVDRALKWLLIGGRREKLV